MRELTIKVYTIDELSQEAQEKAISGIESYHDFSEWWSDICEDAEDVGIKISCFDIDRRSIKTELFEPVLDVCHNVITNHGGACDSYTLAASWLVTYNLMFAKYASKTNPSIIDEDLTDEFYGELDELEKEFIHNIGEEYLSLLSKEYDYLGSQDHAIETINANGYEFLADGSIFT